MLVPDWHCILKGLMLNSPTPNYESAATGTRHSSVITTDDNQLNDPATSYIRSEQAGGPINSYEQHVAYVEATEQICNPDP